MPSCKICREAIFDGIHLSDGEMIHESCLKNIQGKEKEVENYIYAQKDKLKRLRQEIERREGLGFKIISIFSKPDIATFDIEREIPTIEKNISSLSNNLISLQAYTTSIYDYFLSYPPDWEKRRRQVIERDGEQCSECGNGGHLHLHHIKPLSKGGSNKISNLKLLCENCHSEEHCGRNFSGEFNSSETAFSKRLANIRYAIDNGKRIKFSYMKYNEKSYKQRTVKPAELVNLDHHRDSGSTLCVRGYCELREAERVFALKRMKGLKVL